MRSSIRCLPSLTASADRHHSFHLPCPSSSPGFHRPLRRYRLLRCCTLSSFRLHRSWSRSVTDRLPYPPDICGCCPLHRRLQAGSLWYPVLHIYKYRFLRIPSSLPAMHRCLLLPYCIHSSMALTSRTAVSDTQCSFLLFQM